MSDIAIRVNNLGKQYRIGALQQNGGAFRYKSIRDSISTKLSSPVRMIRAIVNREKVHDNFENRIWALRDISFDVRRGQIVGVIGRNGAGKSTLLKILSRVTGPTAGRVEIYGRVGALLEVGTGFHPELTGRENIFMNGAILGMKRAEIVRQFDAIVAFAGVEKFVDTPAKHYSTGMYLRLAFAVAAHLEPEVLLVDEVLAVGDREFQEKCLGKMNEVANSGRTVLCVSHNMGVIQRLCNRAIVLEGGELVADGNPGAVISRYVGGSVGSVYEEAPSETLPTITRASLAIEGDVIRLSAEFQSPFAVISPEFGFVMCNSVGTAVFSSDSSSNASAVSRDPATSGRFQVEIPCKNFRPDRYFFSFLLFDPYADYCNREMALRIDLFGGPDVDRNAHSYGNLVLDARWQYESL